MILNICKTITNEFLKNLENFEEQDVVEISGLIFAKFHYFLSGHHIFYLRI